MTSQEAAALIVDALRQRTGVDYTVTRTVGGDGDALLIDIAADRRALPSAERERQILASMLGLLHRPEGVRLPDSESVQRECIARARGVDSQSADREGDFEVLPIAADPNPEK